MKVETEAKPAGRQSHLDRSIAAYRVGIAQARAEGREGHLKRYTANLIRALLEKQRENNGHND
jgi:hypothetical protein